MLLSLGIVIVYNIEKVSFEVHRFSLSSPQNCHFAISLVNLGDGSILPLNFENFGTNFKRCKSKALSILQTLEKQISLLIISMYFRVLHP